MPLSEFAPSGVIRSRLADAQTQDRLEYLKQRRLRRANEESRIRRSYRHEVKEQQKLLEEAIATEKQFNKRRARARQQRRYNPRAAPDRLTTVHIKQVDLDQFFGRPTPSTRVEIDLTTDTGTSSEEEEIDFDFEPAPVAPTPVPEPEPEVHVPVAPTIVHQVHQEEPVPAPVQRPAPIDDATLKLALSVGTAVVYGCGVLTGAWAMWF